MFELANDTRYIRYSHDIARAEAIRDMREYFGDAKYERLIKNMRAVNVMKIALGYPKLSLSRVNELLGMANISGWPVIVFHQEISQ